LTASEITSGGKPFVHHHAAHCETGVTAALFRDKGLEISEPMVFGIRGIRYLSKRLINFEKTQGFDEACRQLGMIVRMQEEVGTGGAGFRYMYAAFLQEAADLFGSPDLRELSEEMTAIGDIWREFAVTAARIIKKRGGKEETFAKAGGLMLICAGREEELLKHLRDVVRNLKS